MPIPFYILQSSVTVVLSSYHSLSLTVLAFCTTVTLVAVHFSGDFDIFSNFGPEGLGFFQ